MKCLIDGCNAEAVTYGPNEPGHCDEHGKPVIGFTRAQAEARLNSENGLGQFAEQSRRTPQGHTGHRQIASRAQWGRY
jgi:hypothetical protein